MAPLSIYRLTQPVAHHSDERNGMFDPTIPSLRYDTRARRRVYDNPPTVSDAPWWARAKALAAHLSPVERPQPARAPQPACGAQGR
jgi:hypothetical protein